MQDETIIALFWERNEEAIQETDLAYGRRLHYLAHRILGNPEDAEESVNDTYMKAWEVMPPQWPRYFYAFLSAICRNLSLHKIDWKLAAKRNALVVSLSEELSTCIPDAGWERSLEGREIGKLLDAFLSALPEVSRRIFLRRYWFGDTIAEISGKYGMTESKVKMQLSRTRKKLRSFLEKEEVDL